MILIPHSHSGSGSWQIISRGTASYWKTLADAPGTGCKDLVNKTVEARRCRAENEGMKPGSCHCETQKNKH
jgi:hypothetical protein